MEYVSKKETKPVKEEMLEKLEIIQKKVKEDGVTFVCYLVGSSKRNLVIRHHNKGFDCDYQILLQKNKKELGPKELKELFFKEFKNVFTEENNYNLENSTSAITIKKVNKENSNVDYGYDVVITKEKEDGYDIIRRIEGNFVYEFLGKTKVSREKIDEIKRKNSWNKVREKYLELKEKNENLEAPKKSFQIFVETINEVYDNL